MSHILFKHGRTGVRDLEVAFLRQLTLPDLMTCSKDLSNGLLNTHNLDMTDSST